MVRACAISGALVTALWLCSCGAFFVSDSEVLSIALSPTNPVAQVGETEQFVATGTKGDGDTLDITPAATWTSSDETVATVDPSGLATAVGTGTTRVTAKYQRGEGETFLTVNSSTLVSIDIAPSNESIAMGEELQFTATGTYEDGSTRNITSSVSWSSSYTNVATITSAGLATGVAGGSTVITAAKGSITDTTVLTVE